MIGVLFTVAQVLGPALAQKAAAYTAKSRGDKQANRYATMINIATAVEGALTSTETIGDAHAEHPAVVEARKRRAEQRAKSDDDLQARIDEKLGRSGL